MSDNPRNVRAVGEMYPVIEMFTSIQSEGHRAGTLNHFLRLAGCNRNCAFCDTPMDEYKMMSVNEIVAELGQMELKMPTQRRVIITGGEPLVHDLRPLLTALGEYPDEGSYFIAMESNGSRIPELDGTGEGMDVLRRIDWLTVSPKDAASALQSMILRWVSEVKVVVPDHESLIPSNTVSYAVPVFVQPEFNNPAALGRCIELISKNPSLRLSVQTHKYLGLR